MSILDFLIPTETRQDDSSELERTLWVRSLLDTGDEVAGDDLSGRMQEAFYERGEYLFRRGSSADRIYFILNGSVRLLRPGQPERAFGPQSVLGVVDTFLIRPRAFDGLASEATTTLELDADEWLEFLEDNFALTVRIIRRLVANLPPTAPTRRELGRPSVHQLRRVDAETLVPESSSPDHRARLGPTLDLSFVERLAVLRACPPLSRARIQALARLARFAEMVTVVPGEPQPLLAPALHVVETGRVHATVRDHEGKTWSGEVRPGGAVAGLGLLDEGRYQCEVTASEPSTLFRIPTERLFDVMEDHFSVAISLLAHASELLEAST